MSIVAKINLIIEKYILSFGHENRSLLLHVEKRIGVTVIDIATANKKLNISDFGAQYKKTGRVPRHIEIKSSNMVGLS